MYTVITEEADSREISSNCQWLWGLEALVRGKTTRSSIQVIPNGFSTSMDSSWTSLQKLEEVKAADESYKNTNRLTYKETLQ